jgi:hypothetical protein
MYEGAPRKHASPTERAIWFLGATVLMLVGVVIALGIIGYVINAHRIHDIQHDRLVSCQRTYEGVREIFRPLFHPVRSVEQAENIQKFNHSVDRLKARCAHQTGVH